MFPFNITTEHLYTSFLCIIVNITKLSTFLFFGPFFKKNNQKLLSFTLKKTKVGATQRTDLCLRSRQGTYYIMSVIKLNHIF